MIGSTGVAACGHRLGHAAVEHTAMSAAGLLQWVEQYGDHGHPAGGFGPEVCTSCVRLAVEALFRRNRADLIPAAVLAWDRRQDAQ